MSMPTTRKERLEQLLHLAQTYRGWTRKELAKAIGRDPTKLVPASGTPKLDLVVNLAGVLDWCVEVVVDYLWGDKVEPQEEILEADFAAVDDACKLAHREGRYRDMIQLASQARKLARTPEQRAIAWNREAGGWDGLGQYARQLDAVQRGLAEPNVTTRRRLMLQANLANAYYTLWHLVSAKATANDLIAHFDDHPPTDRLEEVVLAFAHYVRGNSFRRLMAVETTHVEELAMAARADLAHARASYLTLAERYEDDSYLGVARTCEGGLMEIDVVLGRIDVQEALEAYLSGLDELVDPMQFPVGDQLESYGYWCIMACNVVLRHVEDERLLQQHMAVFTNKADEIANRLDNWAMRERVFTLEYARRQRFIEWTGIETDWMIDQDDVRVITGTMGRFPQFHDTGWQILRTAKILRDA